MTLNTLTKQQLRFVKEYLKTGNGARSAELAGYSAKTKTGLSVQANRLLKRHNIMGALEELSGHKEKYIDVKPVKLTTQEVAEIVVDRNLLTAMTLETYEDAKAAKNHAVRIQAINTLAKMHGLMEEPSKGDAYTNITANIKLVRLDEQEPKLINGHELNS